LKVLGSKLWGSHLAFDVGDAIDQGEQLGNIVTVRPGQSYCERDAMCVGEQMVFAAQFAPIRGIWAGFVASARGSRRSAIHQGPIPIDLVLRLEFCKQTFEKALPDPCFLPLPKVAQAGESGREVACGRQVAPWNSGSQDEKDARNDSPEFRWLATRILNMAILPWFGQQKFEAVPKVVWQECLGHEKDSSKGLPQLPAAIMPNGPKNG
jgi:hypothetical protein